ncbi:MAG: hypothetical protein GY854_17645 [Deltaproteobacteria bacterium]|nr:hypothetical protein [Deltaproteobacteria bacterium]
MELENIRFEAYREAATRCRWFFLSTVLLAGLILSHLYIEVHGFQDAQLASTYGHRYRHGTDLRLKAQWNMIKGWSVEERERYSAVVDDYGQTKYMAQVTDQTIRKTTFGDREIPLLGLSVPANDYVPVLSIFLMLLSTALWLSMRSLFNILSINSFSESFQRAIHLHFTFTGMHGRNSRVGVAAVVQYLAIWLPAITLAIAIPVDFLGPLNAHEADPSIYIGPSGAIQKRGVTMIGAFLVLVAVAARNSYLARAIDKKAHPQEFES